MSKLFNTLVVIAVLIGFYLVSLYSFLLFHTLAEGFSIIIAFGIFMFAWNSRRLMDNNYLLFIGISYFFVGVLDGMHALAYKGMGVFAGFDANLPTQLWIAARYVQSVSLVMAPLFLRRAIDLTAVLLVYCVVVAMLLISMFYGIFPDCFIEGKGLTAFKVYSEYIISCILVASVVLLGRYRDKLERDVFSLIVWSIIVTIFSELALTFYVSVYGLSNLIGHYFKIAAFYLMYRAIISTGLRKPYSIIVREVKESEAVARESEERFRELFENMSSGVVVYAPLNDGADFSIKDFNKASEQIERVSRRAVIGKSVCDAFPGVKDCGLFDVFQRVYKTGVSERFPVIFYKDERISGWRENYVYKLPAGEIVAIYDDVTERKQAEEGSRQREAKLQSVLRAAPVGIGLVVDRVIMEANERLCDMLGYERDELIGHSARVLYPTFEDYDYVGREKYAQIGQHGTGTVETRWKRKDGNVIDVILSSTPLDKSDWAVGVTFTALDITSRKLAEEALGKSEEQYHRIFDTTSEGIWVSDENFKISFANIRMAEMLGCAIGDLIGKEIGSFTFDEDMPGLLERYERRRQGISEQFERRLRRRDGSTLWVHGSATSIVDKDSRVIGAFTMFTDITQRKETEKALKESEEKYRSIFENAIMGITQATPGGRYINLNPAMARMYGYNSPEEMIQVVTDIGRQLYVNPQERERFRELMDTYGYVEGFESERYRKDGSKFWTSVCSRVVRDPAGKTLYYEGTVEDITSRRHAEEEKVRLESQLRQSQKMEAVGTLAGGVAHDFNNILTVMTGYGTLLQMQMDSSNPLRMYVDQILSASQKAASLTQSLLAFSRQQPITLNPVNLNDVVKGTEKLLKRLLTEDIALDTIFTPDIITVMADSTQIDQILFNLATNARDAMPKGGMLSIETSLITIDKVHQFIKPGRYACLTISDTGTGMDEYTKEHIFDPFFTTKEVGKGTGLGLSTVYGVVKQHNGYITVSSEKENGTTFHIYFPLIGMVVTREKPSTLQMQGGTEIVLIAEDNESVRHLMKTVLTEYGYTSIEAVDGEDALLRFSLHPNIDLLILDSVMPKKNGREVYDEIRKINPHIRVLFTSGYTRDVILDKGIEDKQFNFLSKPILPGELLRKVRDVLDR